MCLAGKSHFFADGDTSLAAISDIRSLDPQARSILYDPGNCASVALYRARADKDFLGVYETVARNRPIWEMTSRSYGACADYLSRGSLPHVRIEDVRLGGRYLLREDGSEADPYCLSMIVYKGGSAKTSTGEANYARAIQSVGDLLAASVDKPRALALASGCKKPASSGSRGIAGATDALKKLQACS